MGVFLVGAVIRTSHAQFFDVQAHGLPSLDIHHCLTCVEGQVRDGAREGERGGGRRRGRRTCVIEQRVKR